MFSCTLRFLSFVVVFAVVGVMFATVLLSRLRVSDRKYDTNNGHNNALQELTHDILTVPVMYGQIDPLKKYAVFSTTSARNAETLKCIFLLPLTAMAWKRIGFASIIMIIGSENVWNSDPLLYTVLTNARQLDAVVIFLDVHPSNSVTVSQVTTVYYIYLYSHKCRRTK